MSEARKLRPPEDYKKAADFYAKKIVQTDFQYADEIMNAVLAREALLILAVMAKEKSDDH